MVLIPNDNSPEEDENDLVDAFNRTGMCLDEDLKREESKKIGQIEVTIMRITIGRKIIDRNYRPKHQEGDHDEVDMEKINSELSHTTASVAQEPGLQTNALTMYRLSQIGALNSRRIPVISYTPYKNVKDPFAIFKFFYRSQGKLASSSISCPASVCPSFVADFEGTSLKRLTNIPATLEKFKFPGFRMGGNRVVRKRNHMDSVLNDMTPLGISSGRISTSKSKRYEGKVSFEEKIKKGRSKKELVPEFNFDGQNRRLSYANAEQSSQSDNNLPSHDNHRRWGVNGIKNALCNEKENTSISPDHTSVIAAYGSVASSISSASHDGKIVVNDDPTLDPKYLYYRSADGFSSPDPNQRASPATNSLFSACPPDDMQVKKVQKTAILSSFSAGKSTPRGDTSSDADDEKEPASDLETCASESDMEFDDDEGPSQNRDDDGLGERLHETLRLGNTNGKRTRDVGGELDEGESREAKRSNTEEGQSQPEGARDEIG